jgi:hypothetical protein
MKHLERRVIEAKDLVKVVLSSREKKTPSEVDREYFNTFASIFIRRLKQKDPEFEGDVIRLVNDLLKENNNDHH